MFYDIDCNGKKRYNKYMVNKKIKPILWPDQDVSKGGSPRGRKRTVPYYKILDLMDQPKKEKILAIFDSDNTARQSLYRLKNLKIYMPNGIWYFYVREVYLNDLDEIKNVILGVYLFDSDTVTFIHDSITNMSTGEASKYLQWSELVDKTFIKLEDQ